jgi:peroxiredoxin
MVRTASTMLPLGTKAPAFDLIGVDGRRATIDDFQGARALLIVFLCNHCPYVKHIADGLAAVCREYQEQGVAVVGINSNDAASYPEDSPEQMAREAEQRGYTFPYLYDETQEVARAYRAACTPDFFLFDAEQRLVYRGQFDSSRPGSEIPVTGEDLRAAMDAVLAGDPLPSDQKPSIGCNIKWRTGAEPDYFNAAGTAPAVEDD